MMDIGSIGDLYGSNAYQTTTDKTASKISSITDENLKSADSEKLMDVCKEFESYFMEQMFKEMKKTVPESEESTGATATMKDYFGDSLTQKYADDATEKDGLGLAQMLYEQMKRNYNL